MQLGELQNQIARFERRHVNVIALSVDEPAESLAMVDRLGLSFDLGSDPTQRVIKAFRIQNPDTQELAIHAVYIVDEHGVVFYRKVGLRRPLSQELIDAIDADRGDYPRSDEAVPPRQRITVAYPQNNFQALLNTSVVEELPVGINSSEFDEVMALMRTGRSDDALVAFKNLIAGSSTAGEEELFDTAAWVARQRFLANQPAALAAGKLLAWRLGRIRDLETAVSSAEDGTEEKDQLLQTLARARAGLSMTQADIRNHADDWNLRYLKTTLRSYREVARAELRMRAAN